MPIPGIIEVLSFKGKDITLFLKQFEKLCKGHRITINKGKLEQIPDYYTLEISNYMENSSSYKKKNWDIFCKAIKKQFRDKDIN